MKKSRTHTGAYRVEILADGEWRGVSPVFPTDKSALAWAEKNVLPSLPDAVAKASWRLGLVARPADWVTPC